MAKIHPNALASPRQSLDCPESIPARQVEVLTVWKKSLLFNCKGFTVFDSNGNLVFRVDKYLHNNKPELLLMDASGNPLHTIRKKKLAVLAENWAVYEGEAKANPAFKVKKNANFINSSKLLAQVTPGTSSTTTTSGSTKKTVYQIEGSYSQRCCKIYDEKKRVVADIKPKECTAGGVSFGVDVFRLVVQPEMDSTVAMALVILLEQMFG